MHDCALEITSDFPGGNVIVEEIDIDRITVRPDLRDTMGDWFYWNFAVKGASGRRLSVRFLGPVVVGPRGPAVSVDGGDSWTWLGAESVDGNGFECNVPRGVAEARFAFAIPYGYKELEEFLARHHSSNALERLELCRSEAGRPVDLLRVGRLDGHAAHRVIITCRHHACEMMTSYVLEGLLSKILDGSDDVGQWLARNVELTVVPFVDADGVERGDQGKNRAPHDHNRDYGIDQGIYAAVRAIRGWASERLNGEIDVTMDLHCPGISGPYNESIYFVGTKDQEKWALASELAEQLEQVHVGPLPYRLESNLPYGVAWNSDRNYQNDEGSAALSYSLFMDTLPHVQANVLIEFPYATVDGVEVNPTSARLFGADLAGAFRRHLSGSYSPASPSARRPGPAGGTPE